MAVERWTELYLGQSDSVMTLRTVYVLVVALVVEFVAQQSKLSAVRWLLIVAFPLFALASSVPLFLTQTTLADIIARLPDEARETLRASSPCHVALVNVVMDVIVVVFLLGWDKWFGARKMEHPARDAPLGPSDSRWLETGTAAEVTLIRADLGVGVGLASWRRSAKAKARVSHL